MSRKRTNPVRERLRCDRTGQPRPVQRATTVAPRGARTERMLTRVPRGRTVPASRTTADSTRGGVLVGAVAAGASTVIVRVIVRTTPSESVTRRLTACVPAVKVAAVAAVAASLKSPSPSSSQAWRRAPSASAEVETSCTGAPASGADGLQTKPTTGAALTRRAKSSSALAVRARTTCQPAAAKLVVTVAPVASSNWLSPSRSQATAQGVAGTQVADKVTPWPARTALDGPVTTSAPTVTFAVAVAAAPNSSVTVSTTS